jgi:AcrR family transcriptional regulator
MSRKPDNAAREDVLEKVISAITRAGLNNLSLRDIAREIGTSARMLIYYFGSYDALIQSIFIHLSIRHKNILNKVFSENEGKPYTEVFQIFIRTIYNAETKKALLLFIELYTKALRDPDKYRAFLDEVLHNWISEIENIIAPKYKKKKRLYATMILAFYRGLMLDWLATRDIDRIYETNRNFSIFISEVVKMPKKLH